MAEIGLTALGNLKPNSAALVQTKPENSSAKKLLGQYKSQKHSGCPKSRQKASREEENGQRSITPRLNCPNQPGGHHRERAIG